MKCTNCGFESQENFKFCAICGTQALVDETTNPNPAANKVLAALRDKLFLVICILITVSCAFSTINGALPVIEILLTIFLWLTYSQSRNDIADERYLRCVSGTVYAGYIVTNVLSIIIIVCGILISVLLGVLTTNAEFIDALSTELYADLPFFNNLPQAILATAWWIIGISFVILGVLILVINLIGMKKIHRFAKSVYQGVATNNPTFANPRSAKNWLIFFAVCEGISTLSSLKPDLIASIASACSTAAIIIAVILINKCFVSTEIQ